MPFVELVSPVSFAMLPVADLVRAALVLSLLAGLLMFFRPLLTGLVRALMLTLRPRTPRRQPSAGA
jgi:hypothetical protein